MLQMSDVLFWIKFAIYLALLATSVYTLFLGGVANWDLHTQPKQRFWIVVHGILLILLILIQETRISPFVAIACFFEGFYVIFRWPGIRKFFYVNYSTKKKASIYKVNATVHGITMLIMAIFAFP